MKTTTYRVSHSELLSMYKLYQEAALDMAFCGNDIDCLPPLRTQLRVYLYGAVYWVANGQNSPKTWGQTFQFVEIADAICLADEPERLPGDFVMAANSPDAFLAIPHVPLVRTEYRSLLGAITHQDWTSRLQTVSEDGKGGTEVFAAILHELRNNHRGVPPVLLNTSFNIKGKPILSKLSDALNVLETTQLDYVFVSDGGISPTTGTLYGKRKA